uniref:Ribosomal RNA-processing protein 7 C-terminal domain-containing protein n=1 Tax=Compsopogon caeruleus TaxID=31354 RepID=A0A7S1TH42_9RHOD|mmetsp:Transcript_6591/g.13320  ORF Transcript_6591/g.13320 Transcript_6591/m.13320 type:complete len:311 (+) Transcript_6591:76-1008(+)
MKAKVLLNGYRVVALPLGEIDVNEYTKAGVEKRCSRAAKRYLYLRRHQGGSEDAVFVANVKAGVSEKDVRRCWTVNGLDPDGIQSVGVGSLRGNEREGGGAWFVRVVLKCASAVEEILDKNELDLRDLAGYLWGKDQGEDGARQDWDRKEGRTRDGMGLSHSKESVGFDAALASYRAARPGAGRMREWSVKIMEEYERNEAEQTRKNLVNAVDDDGFVLVRSGGRRGIVRDPTGASVGAAPRHLGQDAYEKRILKKQRTTLDVEDFYGIKKKEVRRNQVLELRRQFQIDQDRMRKMANAMESREPHEGNK